LTATAVACSGGGAGADAAPGGQGGSGGGGGSGGLGAAGAVDGGAGGGIPDGAAGTAGGNGDAAADVDATPVTDGSGFDGTIIGEDTACHDLANTAPYVIPQRIPAGTQPPTLNGGALADGRYELTAVDKYASGNPQLQATYRRTLALSMAGTKLLMVDLASLNPGNPNETGYRVVRPSFAVTSTADGAFMTMGDACAEVTGTLYRYEAGTGTLTLWNATLGTLQRYTRVP
jgi:hypothetical protein